MYYTAAHCGSDIFRPLADSSGPTIAELQLRAELPKASHGVREEDLQALLLVVSSLQVTTLLRAGAGVEVLTSPANRPATPREIFSVFWEDQSMVPIRVTTMEHLQTEVEGEVALFPAREKRECPASMEQCF